MNDEHKEKIYYIQQQADELSAEISKLMRKDADLSEKHLNELIKLGVFISMTCQARSTEMTTRLTAMRRSVL